MELPVEKKPLSIQILSDVHTEFYKIKNLPYVEPVADCLALCGNIGYPFSDQYKKFIDDCAKKFKYVFVVSGNHEYYQNPNKKRPIPEIDQKIYEICLSHQNTYYLQNDIICITNNEIVYYGEDFTNAPKNIDIIIAGCTLWSFIPHEYKYYVSKLVNDYQNIYKNSDLTYNYPNITTKDVNNMYLTNLDWLIKTLRFAKDTNAKIIVLTHHAPSFDLIDISKISANIINSYVSEADGLFDYPINYWFFGHIKQNISKKIGHILFLTNCMGFRSGLLKDCQNLKIEI